MAKFKTIRQREDAFDARLESIGICQLDGLFNSPSAPAPDPAIGQAAAANAQISRDTLDYYREKDAADKPFRDEATKIALDQARKQVATSDKQEGYADETRNYELSTFRPLEQKIASDALGYDTPERRDKEAAQAQADVGSAIDANTGNLTREVASRGGDVNSGNFTASLAGAGVRGAATQAAAGNQARKNVEAVGGAKLADAAALGRGIAATNATQTQLGLSAGNSGVNNAQVPGAISTQAGNQFAQGAGLAIQGNSSAGNLALGQYQAQNQAQQNANSTSNAALGALGNVAGGFAGSKAGSTAISSLIFSDKKMKTKVKGAKPELSLAAVRKIPVKEWQYKKGSAGDDGGKRHTGAMAQSVNASLGEKAAPGGKKIDVVSMLGHTMNAVKALDKKVVALSDVKARKRA